jgi:hypothetical protein
MFDGEIDSTHPDESLEPALDVTACKESPGRRDGASRAIHHRDPRRWHVTQPPAFIHGGVTGGIEVLIKSHS